MNFTQSVQLCLRKYVDFTGRAGRPEFWWFVLFQVLVLFVAGLVHEVVYVLAALALLLPSVAVLVRRLHDIGRPGWWVLLGFIPVVGMLVLLYWTVQPSHPAPNAWGAPAGAPVSAPIF